MTLSQNNNPDPEKESAGSSQPKAEPTIEIVEASFEIKEDKNQPVVIFTEDPDRKPIILAEDWNEEDVLFEHRAPNLKRLPSGLYAPCILDLTEEDASDIFIDTFDFASSKRGMSFPSSVLTYIAQLFRENIVSEINYNAKLSNPGVQIINNFHGLNYINKKPISVEFMRELEEHLIYCSELSAQFNFFTSEAEESDLTVNVPEYNQTYLFYDLCSTSEIITSTTLFEPFIGRASKSSTMKNLISEGQAATSFLSREASKYESYEKFRDAYDFLVDNYQQVYVGMQATRRFLRF